MDVLLAGESWYSLTYELKGANVVADSRYETGAEYLIAALEAAGATVDFQPCHEVARNFPRTRSALDAYDCVVLSDVGADTLQLTPDVMAGNVDVDRCALLAEYVERGGAVGMIGGYMSFAGKGGQARYARTALADVLPVEMAHHDDRIETPAGVAPVDRGVPAEIPAEWPPLLGYNRVEAKPGAEVWATVDADPLVVVDSVGRGGAFAFTTDCAPHWAPPAFLEWDHLPTLWNAILESVTGDAP